MIVLFDRTGTLPDPVPIGEALGAPGPGEVVLDRAVHSACVDAFTDVYRSFAEHIRAAVIVEAPRRGSRETAIDEAFDRVLALPARPGAAATLRALAAELTRSDA